MAWVYLLLALGALALALLTKSTVLAVLALLAALVLALLGVLGLLAQRLDGRSRDQSMMVDPMELQRLRAQAEARRLAQDAGRESPPASEPE